VEWRQVLVQGLWLCPCLTVHFSVKFWTGSGGLEMANKFWALSLYWLKSSRLMVTASVLWTKIFRWFNLLDYVEQKPRQTLQNSSLYICFRFVMLAVKSVSLTFSNSAIWQPRLEIKALISDQGKDIFHTNYLFFSPILLYLRFLEKQVDFSALWKKVKILCKVTQWLQASINL
jgi:hypothetical protein